MSWGPPFRPYTPCGSAIGYCKPYRSSIAVLLCKLFKHHGPICCNAFMLINGIKRGREEGAVLVLCGRVWVLCQVSALSTHGKPGHVRPAALAVAIPKTLNGGVFRVFSIGTFDPLRCHFAVYVVKWCQGYVETPGGHRNQADGASTVVVYFPLAMIAASSYRAYSPLGSSIQRPLDFAYVFCPTVPEVILSILLTGIDALSAIV